VGGALLTAVPATAAPSTVTAAAAAVTTTTVTVATSDDAHVVSAFPNMNHGANLKLVASQVGTAAKLALLKFTVPAAPANGVLSGAQLDLSSPLTLPARLDLKRLSSSTWVEGTVTYATGVTATTTVASASPTVGAKVVSFDVRTAVTPGTTQAFGVSTPAGTAEFASGEAGTTAPRLLLTYTVTEPDPDPDPDPVPNTQVRIGMSSPKDEWDLRLGQVGGVDSRRVFDNLDSSDGAVNMAISEAAAGRMAILSFKVPGNDWAGAGRGVYDTQLRALAARLDAVNGPVFVTLHHEPTGDGTATDYAAMMRRTLPILGAPDNVDAGPIVNGFWWSQGGQGMTDAEIAQWLPADVLRLSEVVAADTYQGGTTANIGENAGVKITRLSAWATRVGVTRLGIGEYNGLDAASITAAGNAILADDRYVFAAIFNSSHNNRVGVDWTLTGDRLTAFKATVAQARAGG
jgi:hypothetical protein